MQTCLNLCCCCCSDDSLRCVYVNDTRVQIGKNPVPSHLGVNSRRLRHHRPSSPHNCESSRAPKNQLAQKCDCRKMLKIQRARRNNILKHLLCTLLTVCMPSYQQRREHSARCRSTSKTSKKHATAVVDDERGHFIIGMGTRRKEQDENQPQDPESTPSCRNSYKFFHKPPWIKQNMYPQSNQALRQHQTANWKCKIQGAHNGASNFQVHGEQEPFKSTQELT